MNSSSHFFKDKPLFGLDIGSSSIKVMQLEHHAGKNQLVRGYGVTAYDVSSIKDGVIVDFKLLASSIQKLFKNDIIGEITTHRVAVSIPASRTFTRSMSLPQIPDNELMQAVQIEAEQYIPVPLDDLYLDYTVVNRTPQGIELLAVGVPKKIVDSYMLLIRMLGLEPVAFDTTILAASRLFRRQIYENDIPTVLIDFGAATADITIHDKGLVVTGTIPGGGNAFTDLIAQELDITHQEAHIVKIKYGLSKSKKQDEITEALLPRLNLLVKEIRRMIRYHEERSNSTKKIEQIITMGGGANMPGLSDYLTNEMRIPVRTCNPWQDLELGKLQPPSAVEKSLYVTVSGLSLISPKELFT
ncbi:MAG: type IV pilus assembly protein PilM [Candidatus Saccharimonadales bacterium]